MKYPGFVGPSYTPQSRRADVERIINWYPERNESSGAKASYSLLPTPGLAQFAMAVGTPVRGLFAQDGACYAVAGTVLYGIDSTGALTNLGSVVLDPSPATFSSNGDAGGQLFITAGGRGYLYDVAGGTLTEVLSNARLGSFVDGYFLALSNDSTLWVSPLLDGSAWDPTQIAQRTTGSDRWQSMIVSHRDIWLFGSQTTEVWYNAGTSPFPFAPIPGAFLEHGTGAAFSPALLDNSPCWLGSNSQGAGIVWRANGYTPVRISTHAVEYAISQYARTDDAVGWTYQDQGHSFYVLKFPTAGATWVYDAATGLWHERATWSAVSGTFEAWRPQSHCFAFGRHLVGDGLDGTIYTMAVDIATDVDGAGVRRLRRAPALSNESAWIFYYRFQVDLDTGVGLNTGQGSDPQVMLRVSRDGGATFGNERWVSAGKIGQYKARAVWRKLGKARDAVFEIVTSDPVPWRISDAFLDVQVGSE